MLIYYHQYRGFLIIQAKIYNLINYLSYFFQLIFLLMVYAKFTFLKIINLLKFILLKLLHYLPYIQTIR